MGEIPSTEDVEDEEKKDDFRSCVQSAIYFFNKRDYNSVFISFNIHV